MFIKFYLDKSLKQRISEEKNAGNTPYIKMSTLSEMNIDSPTLTEQEAIARTLNDMDEELELLEDKLNKYRSLKEGLMQELLTGKIRLV